MGRGHRFLRIQNGHARLLGIRFIWSKLANNKVVALTVSTLEVHKQFGDDFSIQLITEKEETG